VNTFSQPDILLKRATF